MAQLARLEATVQDILGNALSTASVTVYKEGATVNGNQSGTSPLAVTVRHQGKIATGDTVFINTVTGTTYSATVTSSTIISLSGFIGTLSLTNGDRIVPLSNTPTLYADDQGAATKSNPLTTNATGLAFCYAEFGNYDLLAVSGLSSALYESQTAISEAPGQIRYADDFLVGSTTGGIQEAVNELSATGGVVVLSGGKTYTTSAAVTLFSDVHLRGAGASSTIIKGAAGTTHSLVSASAISRCSIQGIKFDGNASNRSTGSGISLTTTTDMLVRDCEFASINLSGIRLENSTTVRTRIRDCKFSTCNVNNSAGDAAIQGHGNPAVHNYVWVENCYVDTTDDAGIRFDTANHLWVTNCRVAGKFAGGGDEGIVVGYATYVTIRGNEISDQNGAGILYGTGNLATSKYIRILDNIVYDCNNGIKIDFQGTNATISGLQILGNTCFADARTQAFGLLLTISGGVLGTSYENAICALNNFANNSTAAISTTGGAVLTNLVQFGNVNTDNANELTLASDTASRYARWTSAGLLDMVADAGAFLRIYTGANYTTLKTTVRDYIEMNEITAPAAPAANYARLFVEDNGAGKTRLVVRFPTGANQVIATEP